MKILAYFEGPSLAQRLTDTNNRPAGFDYLRIVLAVSVVVVHTFAMVNSMSWLEVFQQQTYHRPILLILPMFFALSGFLVSGSLERTPGLKAFLGLRVLRLWPALAVEIVLSALIIGPVFTTWAMSDYFAGEQFRHYFWNLLGHVQFELPGVFLDNPHPKTINGQLWTLPFELYCYIALAICLALGFYKRGLPLLFVAVALEIVTCYLAYEKVQLSQGLNLVIAFLYGVAIYRYRDRIPFSRNLALLAAAVSLVLLLGVRGGEYFGVLTTVYVTVYLGLCNPHRSIVVASGDYSYGVYLYGYPIQQSVAALGPWTHNFFIHLGISLPLIVALALFSWWMIEKPALKLRRFIVPGQPTHRVQEAVSSADLGDSAAIEDAVRAAANVTDPPTPATA